MAQAMNKKLPEAVEASGSILFIQSELNDGRQGEGGTLASIGDYYTISYGGLQGDVLRML